MGSDITIILHPDQKLSDTSNLFLCALYIREELKQYSKINVQIPTKIYENVNKKDFNTYFSDPLIDQGFTDASIKIEVKDMAFIKLLAE